MRPAVTAVRYKGRRDWKREGESVHFVYSARAALRGPAAKAAAARRMPSSVGERWKEMVIVVLLDAVNCSCW